MRTGWVGKVVCAAASAWLLLAVSVAQKTVPTESGDLGGKWDGPVREFLGVPYAAPPLGPLRWKAPVPVKRSASVLPANNFGPSCMQKLLRSHLPWTEPFMVMNDVNEDCLTLNVWTAGSLKGRRPVLVWIHGGGFVEGSGNVTIYDGARLAQAGVVVVTLNYRMGIFGYFASSALRKEGGHDSAGNYGLADQIAALGWVKRNIAALGGDPDRVTVVGQSAGAESVAELLASPRAKGLLQRAIVNSDPLMWPAGTVGSLDVAAKQGDAFTEKYGGTLDALRSIPAETLLNAPDPPVRRPVVDGYWLPEQPGDDLQHPVGSDVPVMLGWVANEAAPLPPMSVAAYRAEAKNRYGDAAERFLELYPATTETEVAESELAAARDRNFSTAAIYAEVYQRRRQSPVYLYYFQRVPPWKAHPEFGAHHSAELPYFFETLDRVPDRQYADVDYVVSKLAGGEWVAFATAGKPSGDWTPATHGGGPFFVLDQSGRMRSELDGSRAAFWRNSLLKR